MRVLMTTDTVGGVWTCSVDLAAAMGEHGVAVALATMGALPNSDQRRQLAALDNVQPFFSQYKLEWMDNPWDDVNRAGDWLLNIERTFRPDVVHLNGFTHGILPWLAPTMVVGHSCVLSWWEAVFGDRAPSDWRPYAERVGRGLRAAKLVASPTKAMLDELQRLYGPLSDTCVIPNGRNAEHFKPLDKQPLVLAAGRLWDEAKNIAALNSIAPRLPWPVAVAGDTSHPSGRDTAGVHVRNLGRLSPAELGKWMGKASIYVLPARYEPFGLSVLEAAFAGCALVLGDLPSLRENWEDAAVFVPSDDREQLHDAIVELTGNEVRRRQLAERARARAAHYTPARMAAGYLAQYSQLVAANARLSGLRSAPAGAAAEPQVPKPRAGRPLPAAPGGQQRPPAAE
jgi:glycosyltransferase involved in cell wall biosynthesis